MTMNGPPDAGDILQGTLGLLILRTLILGPAHGHTSRLDELFHLRSEVHSGTPPSVDVTHNTVLIDEYH
jgi:hypothetical protein